MYKDEAPPKPKGAIIESRPMFEISPDEQVEGLFIGTKKILPETYGTQESLSSILQWIKNNITNKKPT